MITALIAFSGTGVAVGAEPAAYGTIETQTSQTIEKTSTIASAGSVEQTVREYFHDIPVMIEVARCESTFRHNLADGSVLRGAVDGADTGVMQINKRYHEDRAQELRLNLDVLTDNLAYARYLYEKQGTQPWNASAPCWSRAIAMR